MVRSLTVAFRRRPPRHWWRRHAQSPAV